MTRNLIEAEEKIRKLNKKIKKKNVIIKFLMKYIEKKSLAHISDRTINIKRLEIAKKENITKNQVAKVDEKLNSKSNNQFDVLKNNKNSLKNETFKVNLSIEQYFTYISSLYIPFFFDNQSNYKISKLHSFFIKNNYKGILKYLFTHINTISIECVYSLLYCIGEIESFENVLIIIHDLFLFCDDYNKIFFFSSALLRKFELTNKLLPSTTRMILSYQGLIMKKECINVDLTSIILSKQNFYAEFDLKPALEQIFNANEYNDEIIATLRIICAYMDWNWTYNYLVVQMIYPKFLKTKKNTFLIYLGVIMMIGLINFKTHESVISICEALKNICNNENVEYGVICCVFIKNIDFQFSAEWSKKYLKISDNELYKKLMAVPWY